MINARIEKEDELQFNSPEFQENVLKYLDLIQTFQKTPGMISEIKNHYKLMCLNVLYWIVNDLPQIRRERVRKAVDLCREISFRKTGELFDEHYKLKSIDMRSGESGRVKQIEDVKENIYSIGTAEDSEVRDFIYARSRDFGNYLNPIVVSQRAFW